MCGWVVFTPHLRQLQEAYPCSLFPMLILEVTRERIAVPRVLCDIQSLLDARACPFPAFFGCSPAVPLVPLASRIQSFARALRDSAFQAVDVRTHGFDWTGKICGVDEVGCTRICMSVAQTRDLQESPVMPTLLARLSETSRFSFGAPPTVRRPVLWLAFDSARLLRFVRA